MSDPEASSTGGEIPEGWEEVEREHVRRWREMLGVDPPAYRDEAEAPPIDQELRDQLLRLFVRNHLEKEKSEKIWWLILTFRSWAQAHYRITGEEDQRMRLEGN